MDRANSLTVSSVRNMRELVNPPRIVNNSEEANFALNISCRESVATNRKREYIIELPAAAM